MSEHTPGPWWVNRPNVEAKVDGKKQTVAHCLMVVRWDDYASGFTDTAPERDANSHLIAAAPDMLAALRLAAADLKDLHGGGNYQSPDAVEAAIAKAEGRS